MLGVDASVSVDVLKKAYHVAAVAAHPDKNASAAKDVCQTWYRRVDEAWELLKDPVARREYDLRCSTSLPPGWELKISRTVLAGTVFFFCQKFGNDRVLHVQMHNPVIRGDVFDCTLCKHCCSI